MLKKKTNLRILEVKCLFRGNDSNAETLKHNKETQLHTIIFMLSCRKKIVRSKVQYFPLKCREAKA